MILMWFWYGLPFPRAGGRFQSGERPWKGYQKAFEWARAWKKGSLVGGGGLEWLDHKKSIRTSYSNQYQTHINKSYQNHNKIMSRKPLYNLRSHNKTITANHIKTITKPPKKLFYIHASVAPWPVLTQAHSLYI